MMEFILWVIFIKIVSQVVIIKKIGIIEKTMIIGKDCDKINSVVIQMTLLGQF